MAILDDLQTWYAGQKGRWANIGIDAGYGATCWTVELGNINRAPEPGWAKPAGAMCGASVHAVEVEFANGKRPPNAVVPMNDGTTWPGLEKTIAVALAKAKEFGI